MCRQSFSADFLRLDLGYDDESRSTPSQIWVARLLARSLLRSLPVRTRHRQPESPERVRPKSFLAPKIIRRLL